MSQLPDLVQSHAGQFALLHAQQVVDYFGSAAEAVVEGMKRFGRGEYSVQEVTDEVENLGFYSYAGGALHA
jgi:hypothetical protein